MSMVAKRLCVLLVCMVLAGLSFAQLAAFDDLVLPPQTYWNGADGSGGFTSGQCRFNNSFTDWGQGIVSWEGFAYSNITDSVTGGLAGQYNSITGSSHSGSIYGVGYVGYSSLPTISLSQPGVVGGLYVTNNNYAYYTILNGDSFFGVDPFDDGDWFKLTIMGKNATGQIAASTDFYLADYRNGKSELLNTWRFVDLSGLGVVSSLEFNLSSSDTGIWGMNTPAYFALDTIIPEPATMALFGMGSLLLGIRKRFA